MLTGDDVHVWSIGLDMRPGVAAVLAGVLSEAERSRRGARAALHGAVRVILSGYLDTPPARLRFLTGRWGKPEIRGGGALRFNLSHSGGSALLAVTADRDVGVDVEYARPGQAHESLAARFLPPAESAQVAAAGPADGTEAFLRFWVRKEACVKAAGGRLVQGLRLPVGGSGAARLVADPSGVLPGPWLVHDLDSPVGCAAAVAMAGAAPYRVIRRRWRPQDLAQPVPDADAGSGPPAGRAP